MDLDAVAAGVGGFPFSHPFEYARLEPLGDVNGDGLDDLALADLVVFSRADRTALVYEDALAEGLQILPLPGGERPRVEGAGDINGDGLADLFVGDFDSASAFVVFGKPDVGAIALEDVSAGNGGFRIAGATHVARNDSRVNVRFLGDVDGDGLGELPVRGPDLQQAVVLRGRNTTTPLDAATAPQLVASGGGSFQAGDLDGDGRRELVWCNTSGPTASVLAAPEGWDAEARTLTAIELPTSASCEVADFNGDGVDDLFLAWGNPIWASTLLLGPLTLDQGTLPTANTAQLHFTSDSALIDGDGDGIAEAIVGPSYEVVLPVETEWWIRALAGIEEEGAITEASYCAPSVAPFGVLGRRAGDVNGDGIDDLLLRDAVITKICD